MKVVFISLTGQTRKYVNKLGMDLVEINPIDPFITLSEPFIIVTPTYDKEATEVLNEFLETGNNQEYLKGVAGSGNRNFNDLFVFTAKDISHDYNVPMLHSFEFQGSDSDVEQLKKVVEEIDNK